MIINTQPGIKKTLFFIVCIFTQLGCALAPEILRPFPTKSFVQVVKTTTIKKCKPKTPCRVGDYSSVGSGGVIGYEKGYTAIITAGHVCSNDWSPDVEKMILDKETKLLIRTWKGTFVPARVVYIDDNPKVDLCTIKITE